MCVIMFLKKGQMPVKEKLFNAVYNNWHGYGLVTRVDGKLDIKRVVPETGETDPNEVWKALTDDIDYPRYLHLRHATAGSNDLSNAHPFDVYYDPKSGEQIVFMHNGTFYEYTNKRIAPAGEVIDDDKGPSDTKNYVDRVLIPYIASMDFGNGKGDIHNPLFTTFMKKFWPGNNRGVLISAKNGHLMMDDWKSINDASGKDKIITSNDSYFDAVTRGPEYSRRAAEKAKKDAETKAITFQAKGSGEFVNLKDFNFNKKPGFYDLSQSMVGLVNDWELYDRTTAVALGLAKRSELEELYSDKETCISVMEWIFADYMSMYEEQSELEDKKSKGEKIIATLKYELSQAKANKTAKVG